MDSIDTTETLNAPPKLQIWNNAAFDDGDSNAVSAVEKPPSSWSNEIPLDFISNESFDSECSKENQIPLSMSSSLKSSLSFSAADSIISGEENPPKSKSVKFRSVADQIERDIDAEIDDLEKEICRLSKRLESLRSEKAEQTAARSVAAAVAIRGRIVPSKFMVSQKPSDSSLTASKSRSAAAAARRGVSLGPGEIYSSSAAATKVTPIKSAQNRRKSCFFKLPNIEEGKVTTKARGRASLSLSPRSRKAKITTRQAAATATAGSKRATKKEESVLSSIQPKKLFKEDDKNIASSSSMKPLKQGRVVASRYSLAGKTQTAEKEARKRSLPENNEEKENHHQRSEKRRASDEDCKSQGRVKKRWEIPSEVDLYEKTPIGKELPKIRTLRRRAGGDSPRDSGAAKRVAELESKNRNFTFSQLLKFEE